MSRHLAVVLIAVLALSTAACDSSSQTSASDETTSTSYHPNDPNAPWTGTYQHTEELCEALDYDALDSSGLVEGDPIGDSALVSDWGHSTCVAQYEIWNYMVSLTVNTYRDTKDATSEYDTAVARLKSVEDLNGDWEAGQGAVTENQYGFDADMVIRDDNLEAELRITVTATAGKQADAVKAVMLEWLATVLQESKA